MDKQELNELSFELDYLFETEKDVFLPFRSIGTLYSLLHDFDKIILLNIHHDLKLEYRLENVEYGSLKTRVIQVLRSIPEELLEETEFIITLLTKAKYWLLEQLNNSYSIDSKQQVEAIAGKINNQINEIGKRSQTLVNLISPHAVLNSLGEVAQETNKLPKKEAYQYKTKFGNAILRSGININKPKILAELGEKTEISDTIEIIKPKKVDLLGDSKWECILDGKTREMKVEDKQWLEDYHNGKKDVNPGDSLKVELKTTYSYNNNNSKNKVSYDIVRILGIIKPDSNSQLSI